MIYGHTLKTNDQIILETNMKKIKKIIRNIRAKIKSRITYYQHKKKLKEIRKRDPFIYK